MDRGCPIRIDRREALARLVAAGLLVPGGALLAGCGDGPMGGPDDDGMGMSGDMPDWMMSEGGMGGAMMRDMRVIRGLLDNHLEIQRDVTDVPGGIRSVTTSADGEVAAAIRTHVDQMRQRIEQGATIRHMDPLFREIFEHHEKIEMKVEEIEGGVRVVETSSDPQVVLLIRQHARRAVSEFVATGMDRAMRPTPLPDGYRA
ncbi:MAG: hypothetical protein ACRDT6_18385 [Micromonosporaceae bacterium]